jgi:16S rRNA G527 N7-methylase RsmG
MKITGRCGSEAELIKTILEQTLQIHLLEKEIKKLEFITSVQKAQLAKNRKERYA